MNYLFKNLTARKKRDLQSQVSNISFNLKKLFYRTPGKNRIFTSLLLSSNIFTVTTLLLPALPALAAPTRTDWCGKVWSIENQNTLAWINPSTGLTTTATGPTSQITMPNILTGAAVAAIGIHSQSGTIYAFDRNGATGTLYKYRFGVDTTWQPVSISGLVGLSGTQTIAGASNNLNKMSVDGNMLVIAESNGVAVYSIPLDSNGNVAGSATVNKYTFSGDPVAYQHRSSTNTDTTGTEVVNGGDLTTDEFGDVYNVTYNNFVSYSGTSQVLTTTKAIFYKQDPATKTWIYQGETSGNASFAGAAFYKGDLYVKAGTQLKKVDLTRSGSGYTGWNNPLVNIGSASSTSSADLAACGVPVLNMTKTQQIYLDANLTTLAPNQTNIQTGQYIKYTIAAQNVGDAWARSSTIIDNLPAGTTYLPNSATLNGTNLNLSTYPSTGFPINSPSISSGIVRYAPDPDIATISFAVQVTANSGSIQNQATTIYIDNDGITSDPANCSVTPKVNCATSPSVSILTLSISGRIWHDTDGSANNSFSNINTGLETGTNAGGLNAILVDANGKVIATAPIASDGTYSFTNLAPNQNNVTIRLSTTVGTVGSSAPSSSVPTGWTNTSPLSTPAFNIGTNNITGQDFGIEQLPDTNNITATSQTNPGGTNAVQVPALSATDSEDGALGSGKSFKITTLPTNGTLLYNGTAVTAGQVISNYDPNKLTINPNDGAITVSFTYAAIDTAGKEDPSPATVTMPFTATVTACVPPSGAASYATTGRNKNSILWLNWECYDDNIAKTAAGQPFSFNLPDGSTLTTTVKRTGPDPVTVLKAPTWGGAAIGNGQYNGIAGKPIFYSVNFAGSTLSWQESLTNIVVTDKAGNPRNYSFVTADGESTDALPGVYQERLTFTTDGSPWNLVEIVPQSGSVAPTSSSSLAGVGTATSTWTAPRTSNTGSVILSTNSPSVVTAASTPFGRLSPNSNGKQGVFFGLGMPKITLIKNITRRAAPTDQFTLQIAYTAPTVAIANATSTGALNTVSTGATSVLPGNIITLSETMATGSNSPLSGYNASISCTNANPTATKLPSGSGNSFTVIPQIGDDITCTLTNEPASPNVLLVKRITAINGGTTTVNGDNLALYKDDPTNPYDENTLNNPAPTPIDTDKWPNPNTFLMGGINGGNIRPGDEIEYTIYFLSTGNTTARKVLFCDRIPSNTSFMSTSFNNLTPQANEGLPGADRGISWMYNGATASLTNTQDGDAAQYFSPGTEPTTIYPGIDCGGANTNGAIVVNLGDLPNATAPGTPINSHGWVRFRGRVK
jgi:uncharacterized repeat protein (TIGR01451 family)